MMRAIVVLSLVALGVTAAIAQGNVVEQRVAVMKEMGTQTRILGAMLRGQVPFDPSKAQASLKVIAENAQKIPQLFPEDSKNHSKTEALPAVWENNGKFVSLAAKLHQEAQAATAAVKDAASFKAEVRKVLENCGGCHDDFRKRSSESL